MQLQVIFIDCDSFAKESQFVGTGIRCKLTVSSPQTGLLPCYVIVYVHSTLAWLGGLELNYVRERFAPVSNHSQFSRGST
jgi:hypothetical protein